MGGFVYACVEGAGGEVEGGVGFGEGGFGGWGRTVGEELEVGAVVDYSLHARSGVFSWMNRVG